MTVKTTVTVERSGEPTVKALRMNNTFWRKAADLLVADVVSRILKQEQTDGARIKVNSQGTLNSKRRRGKPLLSLVDRDRLLVKKASYPVSVGKDSVTVEIGPDRGTHVQRKGYTGWFGPSKKFIAAFRELVLKTYKDAAEKAAKKRETISK